MPRKKSTDEKPKLKSPNIIKVKIQRPNALNSSKSITTQDAKKFKDLSLAERLVLSNEVALAQLTKKLSQDDKEKGKPKPKNTVKKPVQKSAKKAQGQSQAQTEATPTRKRGRPKLVRVPPTTNKVSASEDFFESNGKEQEVRKHSKKGKGNLKATENQAVVKNKLVLRRSESKQVINNTKTKTSQKSPCKITKPNENVSSDCESTSILVSNLTSEVGDLESTPATSQTFFKIKRTVTNKSPITRQTRSTIYSVDGRIPTVQLTNIKFTHAPKNVHLLTDTDSTADDNSTRCSENKLDLTPDSSLVRDLALSTTSSESSGNSINDDDSVDSRDRESYKILESVIKKYDQEILQWMKLESTAETDEIPDDVYNLRELLNEEYNIYRYCAALDNMKIYQKKEEYAPQITEMTASAEVPSKYIANTKYCDKDTHKPFEDDDDDDALSLFAESISGIESSKRSSTTDSVCNTGFAADIEYIPNHVSAPPLKKQYIYQPTKIKNQAVDFSSVHNKTTITTESSNEVSQKKTVCETQIADSTSIKEPDAKKAGNTSIHIAGQPKNNLVTPQTFPPLNCLVSSLYTPFSGVKSDVFRGVCFFNMTNTCRNLRCEFPHRILSNHEVKIRLLTLSETHFIREYLLLRCWAPLKLAYGLTYIDECARRQLTNLLIEMAMDFYDYSLDKKVVTEVIENVLLYMNKIDLDTCKHLLKYKVQGRVLCDIFMQMLAETQNFSRFKTVFKNLTDFVVGEGRTFSLDVATHILERFCILPFEKPLAEALLKILKNTEEAIFENSMMATFEKQLKTHDQELFMEFSAGNQHRYSSPDTTNDGLSKTVEEPMMINRSISVEEPVIIKRTINQLFPVSAPSSSSSLSPRESGGSPVFKAPQDCPLMQPSKFHPPKLFPPTRPPPFLPHPFLPPPRMPFKRKVSFNGYRPAKQHKFHTGKLYRNFKVQAYDHNT